VCATTPPESLRMPVRFIVVSSFDPADALAISNGYIGLCGRRDMHVCQILLCDYAIAKLKWRNQDTPATDTMRPVPATQFGDAFHEIETGEQAKSVVSMTVEDFSQPERPRPFGSQAISRS
jgi:hypothetical protein